VGLIYQIPSFGKKGGLDKSSPYRRLKGGFDESNPYMRGQVI